MPSSHPLPPSCHWFSRLASALDPRSAPRLAWLLVGAILAHGRRTVTSWIRAAGLSGQFRPCYTTVSAVGKRTDLMAAHLAREAVKPLVAGADRLTFALDDTPTERYGRHVQGAGVHHNPTPGPAGGPFVYGHVWVVLGLLARHPAWGIVALPLLARLYVRERNLVGIGPEHRPAFRTKLELAVELMRWAVSWLGHLGKPVWVATDGAYATAPFLKPMRALAVTVVSRLRKDAALWTVPGPKPKHRRGPQPTYGDRRIDLAKRGGQTRGWVTGTFTLYGKATVKRYKTFVATWQPAGGAIRVVLVDEPTGWVAFFCTDTAATVADILESVAARFSLEVTFRDLKTVVGAGQQQVRRVRASVGGFHVCLWTFTMTEAWAWGRDKDGLVGHRSASPWDDGARRPSHADKRRAWRRELLAEQIHAVLRPGLTVQEIQIVAERLLNLAA
ncbi:MAG: transposase [Gemmataceae bacterium]